MPLRRSRRSRRAAGADAPAGIESAHLPRRSFGPPETVTPVHRPDSLHVVPHRAPLELSSAADWELEICQYVDALAAAGALDEGTFYVVDQLVRTRLAAELGLIAEEARVARQTTAGLLVGNDEANLQQAQTELLQLRARDAELRERIAEHTARLDGKTPPPAPPATPAAADGSRAVRLQPLPAAPDLRPLLPRPLEAPAPAPAPTDADDQENPR